MNDDNTEIKMFLKNIESELKELNKDNFLMHLFDNVLAGIISGIIVGIFLLLFK